jgi:hypothetical protein
MPDLRSLLETRLRRPAAIAEAASARTRPDWPPRDPLFVIAADHPARGALAAGHRAMAMADRGDLLDRLCLALSHPRVTGVLGTADVLEDLLLLGALECKAVFGSMNRGGLAGADWEIDDRFTAYDAAALAAMGFEGGKLLTRIDLTDPATAQALEASSRAVTTLAERSASVIAAGLGPTSAYTWLKVPVVDDMARVAAATTLPTVLLGGEVSDDQDAAFASWQRALALPNIIGLVVGRSLLYPPDDNVLAAVGQSATLLPTATVAT